MPKKSDDTSRKRALLVLRALISYPNGCTAKQLSIMYNVHVDTIKEDFKEIENAGFEIYKDDKHRYSLISDKPLQALRELLVFSMDDQTLLVQAIEKMNISEKARQRMKDKIKSIYDWSSLGSNLITNQFLTKIDLLQKAAKEQKVVDLIDYRSTNGNSVKNRTVEPFHIEPKADMLHAFDLGDKTLKHYRISRIRRVVERADIEWAFSNWHYVIATDPFRIADNKQERAVVRMEVGGYNELVERFPLASAYVQEVADQENIYELDCKVNHKFYGLSNFIRGNAERIVSIIQPESLREHINNMNKKIF